MGPIVAISTCFNKYATFTGRAPRSEFWWFWLLFGFVTLLGSGNLLGFVWIFILIPYIAVGVRRMHDVGRSGWWLLFPLVNLFFLVSPGTLGDNKYGPVPAAL
jgi:uncharacterized membrane protein YhaH (DUF805 family)